MFQYNFYRLLQEKYPGVEIKADTKWMYRHDPHHGYELPVIFPNLSQEKYAVKEASLHECRKASGQLQGLSHNHTIERLWAKVSGKINKFLSVKNVIDDTTGELSEEMVTDENGNVVSAIYDKMMHLDPSKDYYITSYFTYEIYYKDRLERLKDELMMSEPTDEMNVNLLKEIDSVNSVSIHVRRGDYLNPEYIDRFKILDESYYDPAIQYIKDNVSDPHFYIFSDDIEYTRKMFAGLENAVYVSHNTGSNSFRDMQLMSRCKHNIIANSTFSQWGALLNRNEGHITVYPRDYMYGEDTEVRTMPGWVRMPV